MDGLSWNELTERLKVQLTPYPAVLSIGGLLIAAIIDHYAHGDIATELLYVPPLLVLAYWGGRRIGFCGAALAIILAFIADLTPNLHGPELRVFVQNTLIRLAIFPVIAWLASELKSRQDRLSQLAHEDSLTGLANRPAFFAALETELHRAERHGGATSVLYLDIDHFKSVNDHHGHERGDALLRSIAGELVARVRTTDLVARLGGDEFAILLILTDPETRDRHAAMGAGRGSRDRLQCRRGDRAPGLEALARPAAGPGRRHHVRAEAAPSPAAARGDPHAGASHRLSGLVVGFHRPGGVQ
jgi:GGDEF domain-containing protein